MSVNTYECLFLLDPNKASSDADGAVQSLVSVIERMGGTIEFCQPWGEPKLAYPINKFRKGTYVLIYFLLDSVKLPALDKELKMLDHILRHLTIKLHPMIAQNALAHLRGEIADPMPGSGRDLEPIGVVAVDE